MTSFVSRFDFRAPGADGTTRQALYTRALDMAAYLDEQGHDALLISEHHASDDGYLPSPLVVAAAMTARTRRIPITVSALLVNMYDPVKLAEDVAVLDHLSAGRVSYTLGLGYRPEEYALFGRSWETRGADIEQRIELLLALWRGETVEYDGRQVRVTPPPFSQPHPFLFYGGGSRAAALRAARLGLGFQPNVADKALRDVYNEECRRLGRDPGSAAGRLADRAGSVGGAKRRRTETALSASTVDLTATASPARPNYRWPQAERKPWINGKADVSAADPRVPGALRLLVVGTRGFALGSRPRVAAA